MSIIWKQPNGQISVTTCVHTDELHEAQTLQANGTIPSNWTFTIGDADENADYIAQEHKADIIQQIEAQEILATARLMREVALGNTDSISRLNNINNSIIALRAQL